MKTLLVVALICLILFVLWSLGVYNTLIGFIEAIKNNKKQIDIQLDRRFKVFQSLIETVKQYMDYEKTTLKDVVALRNQAEGARASGDEKGRMDAENQISKIASNLNLVFEQYPDLKASSNVLQLQEEVVNTENKLSFAKQAYNDSIEKYNAKKKYFLESIIVSMFPSKLDQNFEYWGISEEAQQANESFTIKF